MNGLSAQGALVGLEELLAQVQGDNETTTETATEGAVIEPVDNGAAAGTEPASSDTPAETPSAAQEPAKGKTKGKGKGKGAAPKKPTTPRKGKDKTKTAEKKGDSTPPAEQPAANAAPEGKKEDAPKPEKPKRVLFGRNVVGRLEHRLAGDLRTLLVLSTDEVDLEGDALATATSAAKEAFRGLSVKQQYLASMLIERAADKRTTLTPVLDQALRVVASQRTITPALLAERMVAGSRQHQKSTAATQAGVALRTMAALKILTGNEGKYEPNEKSTLLALLSERLALSFVDVEASIVEAEKKEAEELAAAQIPVVSNDDQSLVESAGEQPADDPVAALIDGALASSLQGELDSLSAALV